MTVDFLGLINGSGKSVQRRFLRFHRRFETGHEPGYAVIRLTIQFIKFRLNPDHHQVGERIVIGQNCVLLFGLMQLVQQT